MNSSVIAQDIWHVDGSVIDCDNNGTNWPNAFKYLQDALTAANSGDQIWVKGSETYYPDEDCANTSGTGDWNDTFNMKNGVAILGGFDGTELDAEDRDPVANVTILSGNMNPDGCGSGGDCHTANGTAGCDNAACCDLVCEEDASCCTVEWDAACASLAGSFCSEFDNSYNIVTATGSIGATAILDGFTITAGVANGPAAPTGAGIRIVQASPTIVRCKIDDNRTAGNGGGVAVLGGAGTSDPLFINCVFNNNEAVCYGSGMVVSGNASATVVNSVFSNNENFLLLYPGAGFAVTTSDASGELINCVFVDNISGSSGGGGAGVVSKAGSVVMNNCILWDNDPNQISIIGAGSLTIDYSCIQDGWAGTANTSSNPLFVDLVGGDYRLKPTSPCIDTGNPDDSIITDDFFDLDNDGDTTEATPDLDLNNRVSSRDNDCDKIVDMGVYEVLEGCCPWDLNGDGAVSTIDLLDLFAAWGDDSGGPPDFDCSGAVGTADLLELFANWGACPCPPSSTPLSFEDELDDACISQAEWDDYKYIMQNGTQAQKDNYDCWMRHWIEDCDRCSCLGQSGCPGHDPFGG